MQQRCNLDLLKDNDLLSLILFCIYKCTNLKEYSTISELIYCLNKDELMKLCSIFGGLTIKIPTVEDLRIYTQALLLYKYINIDNKSYGEASKELNVDSYDLVSITDIYTKIKDIVLYE